MSYFNQMDMLNKKTLYTYNRTRHYLNNLYFNILQIIQYNLTSSMKHLFKFTIFTLLLFPCFIWLSDCNLIMLTVTQSNPIVNRACTYSFSAYRNDTTQIDTINILFPNEFNVSAINSCTPFSCSTNLQTVTFNVTNFNNSSTFTISLGNVINPRLSQNLNNVVFTLIGSTNLYSSSINPSNGAISPAALSCSIQFLNYTNTLGIAKIGIVTTSVIPAGYNTLGIQYPTSWSSNPSGTILAKNLIYRNNIMNSNIAVNLTANSSSNLSLSTNPLFASQNSSAMYINIYVSSDLSPVSTIQFLLSNVNMPPTESIIDQISVSTGNSSINFYDQNTCFLQKIPVNSVLGVFQTLPNNTVNSINMNATIDFANFLDVQVSQNDTLLVTYSNTSYFQNQYIMKGISHGQVIIYNISSNSTNNGSYQKFIGLFNTSSPTIAAPTQAFSLQFQNNLTLPNTIAPILFNFTFYRGLSAYLKSIIYLSAATGPINNITFIANPSTLANNSTYTFIFIPNDPVESIGGIVISFPSAINASNAIITAQGNNISASPSLNYTSSSNLLTISNIFPLGIPANTTITLILSSMINPTTVPYGNITITTYNNISDMNSAIDKSSFFPNFTPNLISNGSLTIDNATVGATSMYTMYYQNLINLPGNITLSVIIPPNVTYNNNFSISINTVSPQSYGSFFLNNNLTIALSSTSPIPKFSNITISVNITNPENTMNLSAFNIYEQQFGFQLQNAVFYGFITIPAQFNFFSISMRNYTNTRANNLYDFSFKTSIDHFAGSVFNVTLPTEVSYFSNNITCIQTTLICNIISMNSQSIFVSINTPLLKGQPYSFRLDNIINPRSLKPSSNFIITTSNVNGEINICNGLSVTASTASPIAISFFTNISLQYYYDSNQSIGISIDFITNHLISTDCLLVEFDRSFYTRNFNISSSSCSQNQYNCSDYYANPMTTIVCLKNGYTWNKTTIIIVSGYITGTNFYSTNGIVIISIDNSSYTMDQSNNLLFSPTCDITSAFCQTCSLNNISYCFTCYSNNAITNQIYFFNNSCTNNCSVLTQYYYFTSATCVPCIQPCFTCSNQTVCLSCINSTYLYPNSTCLSTCNTSNNFCVVNQTINTITYVKCLSCNSSCVGCIAVDYCLKCANSSYLLQAGFCVTSCASLFYQNLSLCLPCYSTCGSCNGPSSFQCITCIDNTKYFMTSNNACVTICPNTTVANLINQRCQCDSNCSTCSGLKINCTSCISNYYVNNGICVDQCPIMTYINMGYCVSCTLGCINCNNLGCLICDLNFYLYNGSCYTSCNNIGQGYITDQSKKLCLKCSSGCSICEQNNLTICKSCLKDYTLSGSQCIFSINCAAGYTANGNICVIDESKYGKMYLITLACSVLAISTLGIISKIINKKIFFPYSMMPLLSIVQISSCAGLLFFAEIIPRRLLIFDNFFQSMDIYSMGIKLIMASIVLNYLLNFFHFCVYFRYLSKDQMFAKTHRDPSHRPWSILILILAFLTSFKFYQIVFSGLCHIKIFNTKLSSVSEFRPLHILNALSLVGSALGIFGSSLIFSESTTLNSQFLAGISCIIVIAINIIFVLLSFIKNDHFFDQITQNQKKREDTLEDMIVVTAKDDKNMKNSAKLESFSKLIEFQQDHGQQLLQNVKVNQANIPKVSVQKSRIQQNPSQIDYISSIGNNQKKDLDYQSSMDIPINQKTNKVRYKIRTSKIPLKEKKLPDQILEIKENNNQIEQQKVDTIIDELHSQIHEDGNKNLVNTIQNNQSLILKSNQQKQQQIEKNTKNFLIDHLGEQQRSEILPYQNSPKEDQSIIIKVKPRDKMKSVRDPQNLMKLTPTNQQILTENIPQENIDMDFIAKFYHTDNNKQFTEPQAQYNEVSPSYFNIANQRYEVEDFIQNSDLSSVSNFEKKGKKLFETNKLKESNKKN